MAMGLLSELLGALGGDSSSADLERQKREQVRQMVEQAERGEGSAALGPKIRRRYRFVGSVQGVGFRWTATNLASSVGATGWVMNERDGSVTAEIQGIPEQVQAVVDGLDRYYNGRGFLGGFTIDEMLDVEVISGERDFGPIY